MKTFEQKNVTSRIAERREIIKKGKVLLNAIPSLILENIQKNL